MATVCTIVWDSYDVLEALIQAGYEPSEENLAKVLDPKQGFVKTLQEMSVYYGWEIMDAALPGGLAKKTERG